METQDIVQTLESIYGILPASWRPWVQLAVTLSTTLAVLLAAAKKLLPAVTPASSGWRKALYYVLHAADYLAANSTTIKSAAKQLAAAPRAQKRVIPPPPPATLAALMLAMGLAGCAAFQHVAKTVEDLAVEACELFGQQHPTEFATLVKTYAPSLATKGAIVIKDACAVAEVVQPFVDNLVSFENQTAGAMRAKEGSAP